ISERIDAAGVDRTAGRDDGKGLPPLGAVGGDGVAQMRETHAQALIRRNQPQVVASESEHGHRFRNRHVHLARGVHHSGADTRGVCGQLRLARHGERHEVRHRAAAAEAAVVALTAERRGQRADQLPLERYRSRRGAPGGDVLVEDAREQVRERRYRLAGAEYIAEEAGRRRATRLEHLVQACEGRGAEAFFRKRVAEGLKGLLPRDLWKSRALLESGEIVGGQGGHARSECAEVAGGKLQRRHSSSPAAGGMRRWYLSGWFMMVTS